MEAAQSSNSVPDSYVVLLKATENWNGDQLTVEVDDGTGVVYETVFESADGDTADEYEFGRDGLHTVSLTPESTDGEEMAIPVTVKLGEP